jgi:hypothetical protein
VALLLNLWLRNVQAVRKLEDWGEMCRLVHDKFGKNKYMYYRRQLRSLKQIGSVSDYYGKFEILRNQLLLYNPALDEAFFVDEFLNGLHEDIRAAIHLHCPQDLDTASLLALMQEEEQDNQKKRYSPRSEGRDTTKFSARSSYTPSDKFSHKEKLAVKTDDKKPEGTKWEDRLESLKSYRRSKGLCFTCGDHWSKTHKCPDKVPLHIIEELMEILPISDAAADQLCESESDGDDLMLIAAMNSTAPASQKPTIHLQGTVGKHEILILIDSGSVASFISTDLSSRLQCLSKSMPVRQFTVADGRPVQCSEFIPDFEWGVQGHTFSHSVHVLNLGCYDMILGADWLDLHSPMWVHWRKKVLRFTHDKKRITLWEVWSQVSSCKRISAKKLQGLIGHHAVDQLVLVHSCPDMTINSLSDTAVPQQEKPLHPQVQELIDEFQHLFQEPSTLPPKRSQDHTIPLVPGAQPFKVRPYRYSPQQKDEIERQVYDMLCNGLIRTSTSPFASPVLLVKKDGQWRFCVDYRQLNALIVKNKHPLPIVDELLDELAGAQFFTKLDLRSGYHQIRLAEGEQYKTAFHTHQGLYEFQVMPFGLTNAPATFQSIMNKVFASLLRKGVLVFVDDILLYSSTLADHVQQLRVVFQLLDDNKLLVKRSKCSFAAQELEYLGHIISSRGVSTDPSKVLAVTNWAAPTTLKELRGFLGLTGYYRKFICNYGVIAQPLTQLKKKECCISGGLLNKLLLLLSNRLCHQHLFLLCQIFQSSLFSRQMHQLMG